MRLLWCLLLLWPLLVLLVLLRRRLPAAVHHATPGGRRVPRPRRPHADWRLLWLLWLLRLRALRLRLQAGRLTPSAS